MNRWGLVKGSGEGNRTVIPLILKRVCSILLVYSMLTITHLTKQFGNKKALTNITLTLKEGEIFALIGPNSSGKSTLVKTVTGLLAPTSGKVVVGGHDIEKETQKAKSLIGYIPDEPSVWSKMTGEEFLHFTLALYGIPESIRRKHFEKYLTRFELTDTMHEYFESFSRGNKQKFSITAALSHAPKLLLVDEPIVGLDPIGAEIAKDLFVEFARSGGAVLLVTHTLAVAEEIADRIGFLKHGELIAVGTLEELRAQASLPSSASLQEVYEHFATST